MGASLVWRRVSGDWPAAERRITDLGMRWLTICRPEGTYTAKSFWSWPMGPLLFKNESSDARDHCANERSESPSCSSLHHSPSYGVFVILRGSYAEDGMRNLSSLVRIWGLEEECVLTTRSFPLVPPTVGLHGHRLQRHYPLLPPQDEAQRAGAEDCAPAGHHLLGAVAVLPGSRGWELHQCVSPLPLCPLFLSTSDIFFARVFRGF